MLRALLFGLVCLPIPQVMFDLYLRHLRLAMDAGVHVIPKHHLALHLWDRAAVTGNPKEFANWYDEQLNATLAGVAKAAYPTVYERRVLSYLALAHKAKDDSTRRSYIVG